MKNKQNNNRNVPIGIPTIQKHVPTTTGTTSTKNICQLEMKQKIQVAQV